jgi:hypothetical protein
MKKYILTLITFISLTSFVLADDKQEALNFFDSYVNGANNYSPAIVDMY